MTRTVLLACVCLAFGCSSNSDPFAGEDPPVNGADASPGGSTADAASPAGGGADAAPAQCFTTPARYVVLGDSINACSTIGGKDDPRCAPKIHHEFLDKQYAPGITYENYAVAAAVTDDVVNSQLGTIPTGKPGHVLVNIFIGGNDLQPYIFISDSAAQTRFDSDLPRLLGLWDQIFAFFDDSSRFPDGVTIAMNTQYDPFDDCTAPPYNLSALKIALLRQFNGELLRLASERDNVVITDQHASYLGHGHHYNVSTCPYYIPGADNWMSDPIHPNEAGHAHLASEWQKTADYLYGGCR